MNKTIAVHINPRILLWIAGGLLLFLAVSALREVIVIFFIAFLLSAGLRPLVGALEKRKIPRLLSLVVVYILLALVIMGMVLLTLNTFIDQFNNFVSNLPEYTENLLTVVNERIPAEWGVIDQSTIDTTVAQVQDSIRNADAQTLQDIIEFLSQNVQSVTNTGLSLVSGVTNVLFTSFIVIMLAGYLVVRKETVWTSFLNYIPKARREQYKKTYEKVERTLGEWVVGQLFLMLFIGMVTYIALMIPSILQVDGYELGRYALLLALIAGILELFPNIGPTITFVVTALLGIASGGTFGVLVYIALTSFAIQQLEALFVVPLVMKRAVDLDPIVTILGILAGLQLGGVLGAILSIPTIVILRILLDELRAEGAPIEEDEDSDELLTRWDLFMQRSPFRFLRKPQSE